MTDQPRAQHQGSLQWRILTRFLAVAILPMIVISSISYYAAKDSLSADAIGLLEASVDSKAIFVNNWFYHRFIDLESQATRTSTAQFLEALVDGHEIGAKSFGEYVKSYRWHDIVEKHGNDLVEFCMLYGFYNVLLTDAEGNILFSVARKDDLGTNLLTGPYAKTRFAAAYRQALETGQPTFSDLESYAPSNNVAAGFLTNVILDEAGEKIGVFVIQITQEQIENVVQTIAEHGTSLRAYVVGLSDELGDVTFRSRPNAGTPKEDSARSQFSHLNDEVSYLLQRVDTEQTRRWMKEFSKSDNNTTNGRPFLYDDPNGVRVLGIRKKVSVAGVKWALIAEIPESIAFAPANHIRNMVFGILIGISVLVVIIAFVTTRRIVRPILQLSSAASLVANGDLNQVIDTHAIDEIGELTRSFNSMVSELGIMFRKQELSEGRLRSQTDELELQNIDLAAWKTSLEAAVESLERSNKELDDFAYIASHDLKEPLRGMHNYAMFLLEDYADKLDDEGQSKLKTLTRLSQRMESLIDGLLYYSRVGRVDLALGSTDLNAVLADVLDSLHVTLQKRGIEVHITKSLPTMECDRARIGEVFRNLITNAMKYNDKQDQWIEIGFTEDEHIESPDGQCPDGPVLYVRDNGIGIPQKHLDSIFRIFKRLHGRDKFGGGTGAGLTIVKKIIERHGGRIWIDSSPGDGTTFYFTLSEEHHDEHADREANTVHSAC